MVDDYWDWRGNITGSRPTALLQYNPDKGLSLNDLSLISFGAFSFILP
jgi:hypothetical protein